jgi:branched-chain amino acid aminotransferase
MAAVVYVNGRISRGEDATISVFDHGFLYGEGIYEMMRTYDREPFLFDRHVRRLRASAALMQLTVPLSDDDLAGHVRETMGAHPDLDEAYIRILLTRGVGELSYDPAVCPTPTLVIIVKPFQAPPAWKFTDGVDVALVSVRRNHPGALNPLIKSNNLLNNALAMQEALRRGADEALMQNQAGELVECAQSNFFLVRQGAVLTPPVSAGLVPGVTREFVLELAADLRLPHEETSLVPADLATADEAFMTGSSREVMPVVSVDQTPIGTGRPGPITRKLIDHFRETVRARTSAVK